MRNKNKVELYIILSAIILSLIVLALFWGLNRERSPKPKLSNTSPSALSKLPDSVPTTAPVKTEQPPVTFLGLAKLTKPTTVRALILGDVVAESLGASNKDLTSWYILVANDLHNKYPGTFQWNFKTAKEATIDYALKYVPEVTQDTDLIILCLGRYDWATLTTNDFKLKYEQFLEELKAKSPHTDLFLVVEPPVKNITNNNKSFPYRQVILDLGKKHQIPVIDAWTAFIDEPTPLNGLLSDGINPNDKGYRVFANEVLKKFDEHLLLAK